MARLLCYNELARLFIGIKKQEGYTVKSKYAVWPDSITPAISMLKVVLLDILNIF